MTPSSLSNDYSLFEEQVSTFKNAAASAGDVLRTMLSTMESGMVPSAEHVSTFQSMLHTLQGNYDSLYQTATGLLENSALPGKGCSVDDLGKAVQGLRAQVLEKLREMEGILSEFLAVKAKVASYMDALQDWRTKASELIERMHDQQVHHEELDEAVRPYRLFLKAMGMEDSEEKEMLFNEEIDKIFSATVSRGLYSGQYYNPFPEKENTVEKSCTDIPPSCTELIKKDLNKSCRASYDEGNNQSYTEDIPTHSISLLIQNRPSSIKSFIKNNKKGYIIELLIIIKKFCIITTDQILNFGSIENRFKNIPDSQITSALTFLATKKIIKKINATTPFWAMVSVNKIEVEKALNELEDYILEKFDIDIDEIESHRLYPDKMSDIDICNIISLNERLISYLLGVKKYFPDLLVDTLFTFYDEYIEVDVTWDEDCYICSLVLPEETLSEEKPYRLFVPTPEEGLPELKDLPASVTCFAFYEGTLYRWEQGWQTDPAISHEAIPALSAEADGNGSQENPARIETPDLVAGTMDAPFSAEDHETDAANSGKETAAAKIQSPGKPKANPPAGMMEI